MVYSDPPFLKPPFIRVVSVKTESKPLSSPAVDTHPRRIRKGRRRIRKAVARRLGRSGFIFSMGALFVVWILVALALGPVTHSLEGALSSLARLDQLATETAIQVAPIDRMFEPEMLGTVQTLHELSSAAQDNPLLESLIGAEKLEHTTQLTAQWRDAIHGRRTPLVGTIGRIQELIHGWQSILRGLQRWLGWGVVLIGCLLSFLCIWSAAAQWALYRWARQD